MQNIARPDLIIIRHSTANNRMTGGRSICRTLVRRRVARSSCGMQRRRRGIPRTADIWGVLSFSRVGRLCLLISRFGRWLRGGLLGGAYVSNRLIDGRLRPSRFHRILLNLKLVFSRLARFAHIVDEFLGRGIWRGALLFKGTRRWGTSQ